MYKRYVCSVALLATLTQVVSCSKSSTVSSNSNVADPNVMSGVAATGAPISGGKVKIRGSAGAGPVEVETAADGTYSADIAALTEPYLVLVESPSGEKFISVSSRSALAEGKKVNVTPLSHMIVANVFGKADGDEIFENFEAESQSFTEEKLEEEKQGLFNKLKEAGLIGSSGIVDDSVDLLNGDLAAGTSQGLDGLLDVIEVNTGSAATTGIVLALKGGAPVITDKVGVPDDVPVVSVANKITELKTQLSVMDEIRAQLLGLSAVFRANVACNGAPVDNDSACDVDTLQAKVAEYFHTDFNEEGLTKAQGTWDWFCSQADDNVNGPITSKTQCKNAGIIDFENVVLKDITMINFDANTGVALVKSNVYMDGVRHVEEDFYLKRDSDKKFKLLGNKKSFRYWIETESVFKSDYITEYQATTPTLTNDYSVIINMWYEASDFAKHTFDGDETFNLTTLSGNKIFAGNSATMSLYLVKAPVWSREGTCSSGLAFSTTDKPYQSWDTNSSTYVSKTFAEACTGGDACACDQGYFDWETNKVVLSEAQVKLMNQNERISLTSTTGVTGVADEFVVKRPLILNKYNASSVVPSVGLSVAQFCDEASFSRKYSLSVATGKLSNISVHHGYVDSNDNNWYNVQSQFEFWDENVRQKEYTPTEINAVSPSGKVINSSHLYLSARDDKDRSLVRKISCFKY